MSNRPTDRDNRQMHGWTDGIPENTMPPAQTLRRHRQKTLKTKPVTFSGWFIHNNFQSTGLHAEELFYKGLGLGLVRFNVLLDT